MRVPYKLPSKTFAASGHDPILLNALPKMVYGLIAHVWKFSFNLIFTPSFVTPPTTVGNHNVVKAIDLWDGKVIRFRGGFNHLRAKERLSSGRVRVPDADTDTATDNARVVRRTLHMGPPNFSKPSDFATPCGIFANGELRLTWGSLADISPDATQCTGTLRSVAWLELLHEIRIPPIYEWFFSGAAAKEALLSGRAAYESVALLDSDSFGAIANGDFGAITFDPGGTPLVGSVPAYDLTAAYLDDYAPGEVGVFAGEPEAASDDNGKVVNRATPTALTAAPNDLQPVVWSIPNQKISKLRVAEASALVRWNGSQSTATVIGGRILPQVDTVAASYGALAAQAIQRTPGTMVPKTLSKQPYKGPMLDFMPWKISI